MVEIPRTLRDSVLNASRRGDAGKMILSVFHAEAKKSADPAAQMFGEHPLPLSFSDVDKHGVSFTVQFLDRTVRLALDYGATEDVANIGAVRALLFPVRENAAHVDLGRVEFNRDGASDLNMGGNVINLAHQFGAQMALLYFIDKSLKADIYG